MSDPELDRDDERFAQAATWFARMRGPEAANHRAEFEAWLAADADNRSQYNRAAEIFSTGKVLTDDPPISTTKKPARRPVLIALGASILAIAGAGTWIVTQRSGSSGDDRTALTATALTQLTTSATEQRRVRLVDASFVNLGPASELRIAFDRENRRLFLTRGAVRFEVAHEARPFVVFAGGGSVTAHGTIFDVGLLPDHRVSVRLVTGSVDVNMPAPAGTPAPQATSRRLHPGETVSFAAQIAVSPPSAEAPSARTSDIGAAHDFRDVRLADVVTEANRNAGRTIRLADPVLADKLVSGRFRTDDPDILAERLAALFDLVVDRSNPAEILLRER